MGSFKCDGCFHKRVCQESPAYGTVMDDCPSYIAVENSNSLQQLKAKISFLVTWEKAHRGSMSDLRRLGYILDSLRKLSAV